MAYGYDHILLLTWVKCPQIKKDKYKKVLQNFNASNDVLRELVNDGKYRKLWNKYS